MCPAWSFGFNIWIKKQATKEILQCVQIRFISGHKIIECMHNVQVVNELVKNYFITEMLKTRWGWCEKNCFSTGEKLAHYV